LPYRFSEKGGRIKKSPIAELMRLAVTRPETISLAAGLTDYESLPIESIREIANDLLIHERAARAALQYGTTDGFVELRRAILERFRSLDSAKAAKIALDVKNVVITNGSQQMLYMLFEMLVDKGDIVIVSNPTYLVLLEMLGTMGARVVGVPMDKEGMSLEGLERTLEKIDRLELSDQLKIVYMNTYFQNPTGICYSLPRKRALLKTLRNAGALVVEDACLRELRYDGVDLPSMKSLDDHNEIIAYLGSYSKSFAPGLRIGYGILPDEIAKKAVALKGSHDFGSTNFSQHLLAAAHRLGVIEGRLAKLKMVYKAKRDEMRKALEKHLGDLAGWNTPDGGFYFFLKLKDELNTGIKSELFSVASEEGVAYVPGIFCTVLPHKGICRTLRLSFASVPLDKIDTGVARLGEAIRRVRK